MSKQWGSCFYAGKEQGEYWGKIFEDGRWQTEISAKSNELFILANALRLPVEFQSGRTEIWWQLYVGAIAKKIEAIAKSLPSSIGGVYEFEKDIPNEKHE